SPDAELGVAEPVGAAVFLERLARAGEAWFGGGNDAAEGAGGLQGREGSREEFEGGATVQAHGRMGRMRGLTFLFGARVGRGRDDKIRIIPEVATFVNRFIQKTRMM